MSPLHARHATHSVAAITLAVGLACSASAHAEPDSEPGNFQFYFGGGGGASPMTLDSRDYSPTGAFVTQNGAGVYEITQDNAYAAAYKGFVGLRFFKYFAIEAGAAHLGTVGFTAERLGPGFRFTDRGDFSASMTYAAALLTFPTASDGSYFHLKAGSADVEVKLSETFSAPGFADTTVNTTTKQRRPLVGVGYTSASGSGRQFRIEVEHIGEIGTEYVFGKTTGRANVTMVTASYMFSF